MRFAVSLVAAAMLVPAVALAETWSVSEGKDGMSGEWTVNIAGDQVSGMAVMQRRGGGVMTYRIVGRAKDGGYTLSRVEAPDVEKCSYVAKGAGPAFTGTSICNGAQGPWRVTRK